VCAAKIASTLTTLARPAIAQPCACRALDPAVTDHPTATKE
jgi:hypothetical protein